MFGKLLGHGHADEVAAAAGGAERGRRVAGEQKPVDQRNGQGQCQQQDFPAEPETGERDGGEEGQHVRPEHPAVQDPTRPRRAQAER
ncbi:hypothetical protein [Salipiger sp. PrR003]|uniref:hypothetical protein n=1 Tax=Salipiger sp. PrR003 TaxID=2706776 RepID=UPI001F42040D|nr:hypothetical protein [Salipiger sp. PrR003]